MFEFILTPSIWLFIVFLVMLCILFAVSIYSFSIHRVNAILKDESSVAELSAKVKQLEGDKKAIEEWIRDSKEELIKNDAERKEQEILRSELSDLNQKCLECEIRQRDAIMTLAEVEVKSSTLNTNISQLEKQLAEGENHRIEMQAKTEDIQKGLFELARKREEIKEELQELANEKELAKREIVTLSEQQSEFERLVAKQKDIEQEIIRLEQEKVRIDEEIKERNLVREKFEKVQKLIEQKRHEADQQIQKVHEMEMKFAALDAQSAQIKGRIQELQQERDALLGKPTGSKEADAYADLLSVEPACLQKDYFNNAKRDISENGFLNKLQDYLISHNFTFAERTINAFHTSLKCQSISPLTVLAGVSGTGKTLLPVKYAEFMGMHTLIMPVQPRWDSPQDLFGFYNYLEKKYKATDLSRCLVRMDPYNYDKLNFKWAHDRILLVLLDEMNLARTEYYFSEFLSKLELRRQIKNPSQKRDRQKAEISLDAGTAGNLPPIWVPENILFVGTMNEDESTQTLSDKVLDRSNVLRFGKPPEDKTQQVYTRDSQQAGTEYLPFSTWKNWQKKGIPQEASWYSECEDWTKKLNDGLDKIGRPFGYRVREAMLLYVANYPDQTQHKLAFADQVEQKILPKLRGLDPQDPKTYECLNDVESVIGCLEDGDLQEAFRLARETSVQSGQFIWRGVTRQL